MDPSLIKTLLDVNGRAFPEVFSTLLGSQMWGNLHASKDSLEPSVNLGVFCVQFL